MAPRSSEGPQGAIAARTVMLRLRNHVAVTGLRCQVRQNVPSLWLLTVLSAVLAPPWRPRQRAE